MRNINLIDTQEICKTQKKNYFKFKKEREERKNKEVKEEMFD